MRKPGIAGIQDPGMPQRRFQALLVPCLLIAGLACNAGPRAAMAGQSSQTPSMEIIPESAGVLATAPAAGMFYDPAMDPDIDLWIGREIGAPGTQGIDGRTGPGEEPPPDSHMDPEPDDVDPALRRALRDAVGSAESFETPFLAQVWLMDMSSRLQRHVPDPQERLMLLRKVHREASLAGLQPELVLALIEVESGFNRFAISSAGARGLMQIMPFWLNEIGRPDDNLFHMDTNLRFGCTILRHYLDIENGNMTRALARYNGSRGQTWYPDRVYVALKKRWYEQ